MTRTAYRSLIAATALALAAVAHAQETDRMDQLIQPLVDAKQFMGSVLVARGDQIVFNKAYGSANLEWNIANTPTTKYRIGSITKQFTSASILLLEERGQAEARRPDQEALYRGACGVGRRDTQASADSYVGYSEFHEFPRVREAQAVSDVAYGAPRPVQGQAARVRPRREDGLLEFRATCCSVTSSRKPPACRMPTSFKRTSSRRLA